MWGGGQNSPWDAKLCEKCPCWHNNNTVLISLFDTANNHDKYLKFQLKYLKNLTFDAKGGQNRDMVNYLILFRPNQD